MQLHHSESSGMSFSCTLSKCTQLHSKSRIGKSSSSIQFLAAIASSCFFTFFSTSSQMSSNGSNTNSAIPPRQYLVQCIISSISLALTDSRITKSSNPIFSIHLLSSIVACSPYRYFISKSRILPSMLS